MKKSKASFGRLKMLFIFVACVIIQLALMTVSRDEVLTMPEGIFHAIIVSAVLFTFAYADGRAVIDEREKSSESGGLKFLKKESVSLIVCVACGICAALIAYLSVKTSSRILLIASLIPSILAFDIPYELYINKKDAKNVVLRRVVLIAEIVIVTVLIYWLLQCFHNVMNG